MRKLILFLLCLCLCLCTGTLAVSFASASDDTQDETQPVVSPSPTPVPTAAPVESLDFEINVALGYDGLLVMGRQCPALVSVTNHGSTNFDGMLGINIFYSQAEYDRYEIPLTLASDATKQVSLPFTPRMRQDMFAFELTRGGEIIAEKRVQPARFVSPETVTIGVLSETASALDYLSQRANNADTLRGEVWMPIALDADTFPQTADLLATFPILVIDGIDARTLSQAQQEALSTWLMAGGIVFISGGAKAAAGYPFFAQWTGASASKPFEGEDISAKLLEIIQIKGDPLGQALWQNELPGQNALAVDSEGRGVLLRTHAGSGTIYTAAFDFAGEPMASWKPMASFWPRLLRQNAPLEYQRMLNELESARYSSGEDFYSAQSIISRMPIDNPNSGLPVLLLLAAYLFIAGFGGYLVLKRFDKREWLWVAAPVSAIVFALLMLWLSQGTQMNKPAALTASRVIFDGGSAQTTSYIGVATAQSGNLLIETDQQQMPTVMRNESYYYDDNTSGDKLFRPQVLRQTYRLGAEPAVGFASADAWDAKMLRLSSMQNSVGSLDVQMWMEKDGLHGEAKNLTDLTLHDCIVVTSFGFCTVGSVLPGEVASFSMLYPEKPHVFSQTEEIRPKANILYSTLDIDLGSLQNPMNYLYTLYSYLDTAIYPTEADYQDPQAQQRSALVQLFDRDWSFYRSSQSFYFFAFNDTLGKVNVVLNGSPVTRTAHAAALGTQVEFEPMGRTGQVFYPQGYIPGEIVVDEGDEAKPRIPTEEDGATVGNNTYGAGSDYVMLNSPIALRFQLPKYGEYTIEKMILAGSTYESLPTLYLYNNTTRQWDMQLLLTVSMSGEDWKPYIDRDGSLYARYIPSDVAGRYEGMQMPTLSLRGEVN